MVIADYEPLKFSSFRVFTALQGTILQDKILMVEQLIITLIFVACALPVYPATFGRALKLYFLKNQTHLKIELILAYMAAGGL